MLIQNETLKNLLEEKRDIVEEGKKINVEIEKKAQVIACKFLTDMGLEDMGDSGDSFGDGTNFYKSFKGSFLKLQQAFRDNSTQVLQETIKKDLEEDINLLKSKELQVIKLNEKVNDILRNEIIPTLGLKETEELTLVELKGIDIELTIVDVVEEYKKNYLEKKNNNKVIKGEIV